MALQEKQIKVSIKNNINVSNYLIDEMVKYANSQAEKDRFNDNGDEIYEVSELQLFLCSKDSPIGSYERKVIKIWVKNKSKRFYSLLKKRDNYQHSERYDHWVKDEKNNKFRFDLDFNKL